MVLHRLDIFKTKSSTHRNVKTYLGKGGKQKEGYKTYYLPPPLKRTRGKLPPLPPPVPKPLPTTWWLAHNSRSKRLAWKSSHMRWINNRQTSNVEMSALKRKMKKLNSHLLHLLREGGTVSSPEINLYRCNFAAKAASRSTPKLLKPL